jgi:hypothetical protein
MLEWVDWDLVDLELDLIFAYRRRRFKRVRDRMKAMVAAVVEMPGTKAIKIADLFQIAIHYKNGDARVSVMNNMLRPLVEAGVLEFRKIPQYVYGNPAKQAKPLKRIVKEHDAYYLIGERMLKSGYPPELRELPFEVDGRGRVDRYRRPRRRQGMNRQIVRRNVRKKEQADAMRWAKDLKGKKKK